MKKIILSDLKAKTGVGFGTSGIRDLATSLTNEVVYCYTAAFVDFLKSREESTQIALAGDLRDSTNRIMKVVAKACTDRGVAVVNCGLIPSPAVAYFGLIKGMSSIMVTGSHIPADRNGVKFNLADREILKEDEEAITQMEVDVDENLITDSVELPAVVSEAKSLYIKRYTDFFGNEILKGKRVGLYGHSAVGRDLYVEVLEQLGVEEVVKIDYSDSFVSIDTETVDEDLISKGKRWSSEYGLNYIISTDGDGDRPLLSDESGLFVKSELLPVLTARFLEIDGLATTLTSNTLAEKTGWFKKIIRTKVGSPYVLQGMIDLENEGYKRVAAYEANGGFLLQTDIGQLKKLPTRDALIVILGAVALGKREGSITQMVDSLPKRTTYASSLKGIPTEKSLSIVEEWEKYRGEIEAKFGKIENIDRMDGLRLTFENGDIVHFRPSKNSPEFRDYTESETHDRAKQLSIDALSLISRWTK